MESNDKLKEIDIKSRTCCYFDDIIKIEDYDLDNILIDEKSYENILVYSISYKTLIDFKPLRIRFDNIDGFIRVYDGVRYLRIRFDNIDGFIRVYDGVRYLVLFRSEKYDFIYNRIRCLISVKNGITYVIPHNYAIINVDSYDPLPLEKNNNFS